MDPEWTRYRDQPWDSADNLRLARRQMPWCYCPGGGPPTGGNGLTATNYVGATGVGGGDSDPATLPEGDPRAGAFGYNRRLSRDDIKDGLDTTVMVVVTTRTGPWMAGGWPTVRGLNPGGQPYIGTGRPLGGTHRGGMLATFADGSCRFIPESVSPDVLEALFTTAAGDDPGPLPGE
jgi:hypothetical protein